MIEGSGAENDPTLNTERVICKCGLHQKRHQGYRLASLTLGSVSSMMKRKFLKRNVGHSDFVSVLVVLLFEYKINSVTKGLPSYS